MYASYATGPYVSPCGFADSQRPFVWMRSRISPELSAGPHAWRLPSTGKLPHGAWPLHDALRADHAGVADVDDIRRLDVEADAETGEEHGRRGEPMSARARAGASRGP